MHLNTNTNKNQFGISMIGVVFALLVIGAGGAFALKIVPFYTEYKSIAKAVKFASENAKTAKAVRDSFDAQLTSGYISSISANDLEITQTADGLEVSFQYEKKIHLVKQAYLLFEFSGTSRNGN